SLTKYLGFQNWTFINVLFLKARDSFGKKECCLLWTFCFSRKFPGNFPSFYESWRLFSTNLLLCK
ncbi:MAG: hypothetical protein WCI04_01665, partial [archaeon]